MAEIDSGNLVKLLQPSKLSLWRLPKQVKPGNLVRLEHLERFMCLSFVKSLREFGNELKDVHPFRSRDFSSNNLLMSCGSSFRFLQFLSIKICNSLR